MTDILDRINRLTIDSQESNSIATKLIDEAFQEITQLHLRKDRLTSARLKLLTGQRDYARQLQRGKRQPIKSLSGL